MITLAYLIKTTESGHPAVWVRNEKLVPLFQNPENAKDIDKIINALGPGYADLTSGNHQAIVGEIGFNNSIVNGKATSYLNYSVIPYDTTSAGTAVDQFPQLNLVSLYGENARWLGSLTPGGSFTITTKNYNLKDLMGKEVTVAKLVTRTVPMNQTEKQIIGCFKNGEYDNGYTILYAKPSYSIAKAVDFETASTSSATIVVAGEDNVSVEFYPGNYYDASVLVPKIVNDVSSNFVAR